MDQTLSYGLGAGSGVVEYYLAKKLIPTSPNLAAGALGVATLGLKLFNVIPTAYGDIATANALTLIAIAGANAVTNPSATTMGVVTLRSGY